MNAHDSLFASQEIGDMCRRPRSTPIKVCLFVIVFSFGSFHAVKADLLFTPDSSVTYVFDEHLISGGRLADHLSRVAGLPLISSKVATERRMLFAQVQSPRVKSRGTQRRKRPLSVERLEERQLFAGTTINIDQDFVDNYVDAQGNGEVLLIEADATYILQTDITTNGTAIVVGNKDITLDLNGHTVTYGNAAPIVVTNGGFEQGTGTDVVGWDITGASSARLASNDHYLFGDQVLRLEDFSTTQVIVSSTIDNIEAGHTYSAHITPGARADYRTQMTLSVIDVDTGEVLASSSYGNVERGIFDPITFFADANHSVQLRVELTPGEGVTTTVELDYATLSRSFDYGVLATRLWSGGLAGYENLTEAAKAVYWSADNFTLISGASENGHVTQGQAKGLAANPLMFEVINGLKVTNIETFSHGIDTQALVAANVGANSWEQDHGIESRDTVIRDSVFRYDVDNITNRMRVKTAISVYGHGNIFIEGNVIDAAPQAGIVASNSSEYELIIRSNMIHQRSVVTNGYGIVIATAQRFEISGNVITADSGRGIMIDGYSSIGVSDGDIFGNYVEVKELPNREYYDRLTAHALRIRNHVDAVGAHRNIRVYGNEFVSTTGAGLVSARGGTISYENRDGQMDDAGIVLEGNVFRALTNDGGYEAKAFVLDGVGEGINVVLRDNQFESNDVSLQIGYNDGGNSYDTTFISNTISKLAGPAGIEHKSIVAGFWIRELRNIRLVDMQYANGAVDTITWSGEGDKELIIEELLSVQVQDGAAGAIAGASVTVAQASIGRSATMTTDANGDANPVAVVREIWTYDGTATSQVVANAEVTTTADGFEDDTRTVTIADDLPDETVTLQSAANDPPTLQLSNVVTSISEIADTSNRIKIADYAVVDDGVGSNIVWKNGADKDLFEFDSGAIYLKAGSMLDADSNPTLDLIIKVDDVTVGATPDDVVSISISVIDVINYANNVEFVRSLYTDVLHRDGSQFGVVFWATAIENGTTRDEVAEAFLDSRERLNPIVTRFYSRYLNRTPDAGGLNYWVSFIQGGGSVGQVEQLFVVSPEYTLRHPGSAYFVTDLYYNIHGRFPDWGGLNYWVNQLDSGVMTRAEVASFFLFSDERLDTMVGNTYYNYFDEAIDQVALSIHIQDIQDGAETVESIAEDWLASDLYYARLAS